MEEHQEFRAEFQTLLKLHTMLPCGFEWTSSVVTLAIHRTSKLRSINKLLETTAFKPAEIAVLAYYYGRWREGIQLKQRSTPHQQL